MHTEANNRALEKSKRLTKVETEWVMNLKWGYTRARRHPWLMFIFDDVCC